MIPLDTDKKNVKKILEVLSKDKYFLGGCVAVPLKEIVYKELLKKIHWKKLRKR